MAVYAEVQGQTLIKFPYTAGSLMEENPYTNFGSDPDLATIFPQTETAINNGYTLVEVTYLPEPQYNPTQQTCNQNTQPTLVNGVWTVDWTLTPNTPEQTAIAIQNLITYAGNCLNNVLSKAIEFNVAASGAPVLNVLCDGTNNTRADLGLLALFGLNNPNSTKVWIDNNNVSTTLTGTQLVQLTNLAGNWVSNCYLSYGNIVSQINAGTINTTTQIDAFQWPTS
jgi:hypothetical protein